MDASSVRKDLGVDFCQAAGPAERGGRLRVLIADGQEIVRAGLVCLLKDCGYEVVGEASSGEQAVALWQDLQPDVLLLDLHLPDTDGVDVIGRIRSMEGQARCVALTNFDGDETVRRVMRAGAAGYVLKRGATESLRLCLERVRSGGRYLPEELALRLVANHEDDLPTPRESEVLKMVAHGLCNKRIGRALGIEEGTVKAHLKSILRKLDAASRTEAASIAIRRGLVSL
ncbi:MAG: response regulator transcription factor [Nevskia sp.]|nr:response regulator transcription factor [Nevskia sp.]